jgi:hypothetical protein
MGVLADLIKIANDQSFDGADDLVDALDNGTTSRISGVSYDSIAKQAKNGVMQFPMISSRSLSYENLQMISKACERQFASFLQVIFTMNQVTDTQNPQQFVSQYHQNMNTTIRGARDVVGLVFNSMDVPVNVRASIMVALKEGSVYQDEIFEMTTLNEKFTPVNVKRTIVKEARSGRSILEATTVTPVQEKRNFDPNQDPVESLIPKNIFQDNDAKKANELIPTLMHVRILKDMGEDSKYIDFVVGVKAMIHPVASEDMIKHIVAPLGEHGKLNAFIRWTTGELAFFKDLILALDKMKGDVTDIKAGKSSTWWRALKNIKTSRRFHRWTRTSPVLPNASLVISTEEVDYIKANHGFDLMDDKTAARLLEAYSLLSLVIVDAAMEVAHFFNDGSDHFSSVTFKGLERQNGDADKQFKEILKAVNKLQ